MRPHQRLGRYLLLEHLGAGGLGSVWSAWDPELERGVAIKVVNTARTRGDATATPRLVREAKAVARVRHPNVVAIHDVGTATCEHGGLQVYVVLELVEGTTLAQWLLDAPRSRRAILAVFLDVARGLVAVHAAGLVHRDVKPHNVVVEPDPRRAHAFGRARLLDFGLARAAADLGAELRTTRPMGCDPETTCDGFVVGTAAYMPPEQHRGEPLDPSADQYAFCVALHEALFGRRPFDEPSLDRLYDAKRLGLRRSDRPSSRDGAIDRMLRRGLSPYRDERHRSMAEIVAILERELARSPRRRALALGLGIAWTASIAVAVATRDAPIEHADAETSVEGELWAAIVRAEAAGDERTVAQLLVRLGDLARAQGHDDAADRWIALAQARVRRRARVRDVPADVRSAKP